MKDHVKGLVGAFILGVFATLAIEALIYACIKDSGFIGIAIILGSVAVFTLFFWCIAVIAEYLGNK